MQETYVPKLVHKNLPVATIATVVPVAPMPVEPVVSVI